VGWSSPIAVRAGDHDEIVLSGQQAVRAYDPDTGRELWHVRGNTYEAIPTPVVGHGMVFCSSGRAGPTLAIRPGGRGNVTVSHLAWRAAKGSPFVPSTVLDGGILYLVNDMASVATAYDAANGKALWQGRLGEPTREGFSASPVVVDGKIFFTSDAGDTFVLAGGREFRLLHVNSLGEAVLASPALVDGTWYVRGKQHLYAIGKPSAASP
jgi:outer membrane protein assembly factor BamB